LIRWTHYALNKVQFDFVGDANMTIQRFAANTILVACGVMLACAINPATGKRQLALISEGQEIAIGKENDQAIVAQLGLYPDEELQRYIQALGDKLAATSERPGLDWTFRVVDDPIINAFALPGGYIYVTRGILAHLDSEAELAAVIGHEIGHVTARHGVSQMSKGQLAQLGFGIAMATSESLREYGQLAETGLAALFMKFSRDDERQSDDLGLRYLLNAGYDPRPMSGVYDMRANASRQHGAGRIPPLFSTHPAPENRAQRINAQIADLNRSFEGLTDGRDQFMARIDGIAFGEDPRQGFFKNGLFMHPEMEFSFQFPADWQHLNQQSSVSAGNEAGNAMLELTMSGATTAEAALAEFFKQEALTRGARWVNRINGRPTGSSHFTVTREQGDLRGVVAFVKFEDKLFQLLALTTADNWTASRKLLTTSLSSFDRLTDKAALAAKPARLSLVRPDRQMALQQFAEKYHASVDLETLALVNHLRPADRVRPSRTYKIITGGMLPH
jgi:predicted Zn-dependent protease